MNETEALKNMVEPGLSYKVVTFGCQMNARDSEKLSGVLEAMGLCEAEDELEAEIVVFNTCTVRENANEHLYGRLGRLKKIKKEHPSRIIVVAGCMMQEKDEVEKLRRTYPYVDLILGTHNLHTFPELLLNLLEKRGRGPVISIWDEAGETKEDLPSKRKYPFKQGVNIMYGCNNFCTYCIVPYVRGRERSRAPDDILDEIERIASEGVKEIMLLGQNVNSYAGGMSFASLLQEVDSLAGKVGIERIRFMTSHPKDLSEELIDTVAGGSHICRQFHLPLQSGSDRVLHLMNRHYSREDFTHKALMLRDRVPGIVMSTDIIVGFPSESEEDFQETLGALSDIEFDFAYTFIYSRRQGTPAAGFGGEAAKEIVSERFDRLLRLQNSITASRLTEREGSIERVLFESVSERNGGLILGKTDGGVSVHVKAPASLIGSFGQVRITECRGFYYMGELDEVR